MRKLFKALLASLLCLGLCACGENSDSDVTVVKVGVVGSYNAQWDTVNELLKDDNIKIELVPFSDYAQPNSALNNGDIDMNAFQHHAYLENEIAKCNYKIAAIGDTIIAPLGIYPNKEKITKLEDIKDGDIIAIPSDATNGGRALKILEEVGLIEVDPATGYLPTKADITKYNVKIEIKELESAMLASILPDVTAALINGGNAYTAGLNSVTDTIYLEDVSKVTDIDRLKNLIAVRSDDVNNEVYKKVVEAYQTAEVKQTLQDAYKGAFIPAWE